MGWLSVGKHLKIITLHMKHANTRRVWGLPTRSLNALRLNVRTFSVVATCVLD